jgi:ribosomal protein S2
MNNYKKVINDFLNLFQLGILTAKDIKQEISNIIQFKKEKIMNHFNNYTQEDLKELKKKINKLNLEIENLKKLVRKR